MRATKTRTMRALLLALSLVIGLSSVGASTQRHQQGEQDIFELTNEGRALKQFGFFNGGSNVVDLLFGTNNNNGGASEPPPPPPPPPPSPSPPPPPQQQQQTSPPPPPPPQQQTSPPPPPPAPVEQQTAPPPQVEISANPVLSDPSSSSSSVASNNNNQIVELLAPPPPEQPLPQTEPQQQITNVVTNGASPSLSSPSSPSQPSSSSVQLTGSRFTPAPAVFTPTQLPTYPQLGRTSGPVSASTLSSIFPTSGGDCKTLGEVLSAIPEASQWLALMKKAGGNVLLSDKSTQTTLLVPINSAFSAGIDAQPLRPEKTMQELINNAPDIVNPLVGYSVLRGLWPSATFIGGASVPTANTIDKVNPLNIQAKSQTQLQGIGNSANILQADIAACGPSVVHIIDQILLPFSFDQKATDAITGTQVPQGRPGYAAAGK